MKTIIQSVKGARDFYPREMSILTWIYNTAREVSESFGYQEYDGPFLETIELYAAKSGEELVKEQSFVFSDRGGNLITLRPELTPTLVRMVAQRQRLLTYPLRWWSFGPFWRYERPQKGRSREFFQWNIDLIGVNSPEGDAELAGIIAAFFKKTGLSPEQVTILINNRRLMDSELNKLMISDADHQKVFQLIDRRAKMDSSDWEKYAIDVGMNSKQLDGLNTLLSDSDLWKNSNELVRFFSAIDSLGYSDYVRYAPYVIRGLDYYTGTVFEAQDLKGVVNRAILGGGRYDNLMEDVGGDSLPGVGFAMGDMVISLILEKFNLLPDGIGKSPAQVLVTVFGDEQINASISIAAELRENGIKVNCYPEAAKLGKQFRFADRIDVDFVIVLGPDEISNNQVTLKHLKTGDQQTISRSEVVSTIHQVLDADESS
jgi:histidyl-tRNA synthetase